MQRKKKTRRRYRDPDFLHALGARIRQARLQRNYSIDRMYLELSPGFSRATIGRIEKGEADPQASTLKRIAEVLHIPLWELMKF